jgi:type I restriction enzyme S subunit
MKLTKIGEFLKRSKIPINIEDDIEYNRVTIRINHNGVSLRDSEIGKKIGTKKQFILKEGQFIVSKIDARYGAFGIAPDEVDNAIITGNFWAYDVDSNLVNIDWFNQFTNSPIFYEVCERASSGITHRKYLDEKFFLNYQILLPSVEEQLIQIENINSQKISFGEISAELTHQLDLVKKLRQQLLQDAVQGKLVKQDQSRKLSGESASELLKKIKAEKLKLIAEKKLKKEKELPPIKLEEIPFEIPDNWEWCRLGEIVNLVTSGSRDWAKYYSSEGEIFVRMGNLSRESYNLRMDKIQYVKPPKNQEGNRTRLEADDILISITGEVGNLGLIPKDFGEAYINQHTALVRLNKEISVKYICNLFLSKTLQEQFNAPQRGMKNSFRLSDIDYLLIPLPPREAQNRIVQKLDELMQYCTDLEASIKQSQQQNEKLLQQVLREALRREGKEI